MRVHRTAACLFLASCLGSPCLVAAPQDASTAGPRKPEPVPLTRLQGTRIMTQTPDLATMLDGYIRNPPGRARRAESEADRRMREAREARETPEEADDRAEREAKEKREADVLDDLRDVLAHASEWRWYLRDRGVLLAIPVQERLGILAAKNGERTLADIVRRLIDQQGLGNPPVQVVFIAPELPCPVPACGPCATGGREAVVATVAPCDCR